MAVLKRLIAGLCALAVATPFPMAAAQAQVRFEAIDLASRAPMGEAAAFELMARAGIVLLGEQHDDPGAHRFQLQALQAMAARGRPVVLALEMFDRDVQPAIDDYTAGRIDEAAFLSRARPWPNYVADYRPLVEFARDQGWPVLGTNVPRRLAAAVAREGLTALEGLGPAERVHAAMSVRCDDEAYRERFEAVMRASPDAHGPGDPESLERLFHAQCLRDETMAEAILEHAGPGRTVVHLNGAFHSRGGHGVPASVLRRDPDVQILAAEIVPADAPREGTELRRSAGGIRELRIVLSGEAL